MNKKENPMSNVERQRKFREKQKERGAIRKSIWLASGCSHAKFTSMEWQEFTEKLNEVLKDKTDEFREMTYAELLSYLPLILKGVEAHWKNADKMAGATK